MSTVWTCIKPARSIDQEPYIEGEEFPACDHFQRDWTVAQAREHGYAQPFDGDYANRVQGSDCTLFGRPVTSPKAAVFISDVFRSAYAQQVSIESWYGIPVHRFGIQYKDMLNASVNPENAQYYSLGPSGLLNLTKADNLPVFVSFPHFYMADSRLVEAVEGLSPRKEIHETVVDVEPNTGALVRAKKRLQVNYQIDSYSFPEISQEAEAFGYGICENITHIVQQLVRFGVLDPATVPDYQCDTILLTPFFKCLAINGNWSVQNDRIFHPYGWVNEAAELPESDATDWKNSLFLVYDIADKVRLWSLVAAGLLFGALVAALYSLRRGGQSVEYEAVKGDCVEGGAVVQPLIPHDILDKTCV